VSFKVYDFQFFDITSNVFLKKNCVSIGGKSFYDIAHTWRLLFNEVENFNKMVNLK